MRGVRRFLVVGLMAAAVLPMCGQQQPATPSLRDRRIVVQRNAATVLAAPARQRLSTAQAGPARQPKPMTSLSDAPVLNLDGGVVQLASAMPTGNWLLLYRTAQCVSCDRLVNALAESGTVVRAAAKQVVIVQGNPHAPEQKASGRRVAPVRDHTTAVADAVSGLRATRAETPPFSDAAWFYDRRGLVYRGLQAQGTPLLLGMRGSSILWRQSGAGTQPAEAQARAASWISAKTPEVVTAGTAAAQGASTGSSSATAGSGDPAQAASTAGNGGRR